MKTVYKFILISWLTFLLSSCNWQRCKVEGKILVISPELQSNAIASLSSPPIIQQTIENFDLRNKNGKILSIEEFSKNLSVKSHQENAQVFSVSYRNKDRELAVEIVNYIMGIWMENQIILQREQELKKERMKKELSVGGVTILPFQNSSPKIIKKAQYTCK